MQGQKTVPLNSGSCSETVSCAICGADETRVLFQAGDKMLGHPASDYSAVRCRRCGLVYLSPRPSAEDKGRFYQGGYVFYETGQGDKLDYGPFIEYLSAGSRTGKVLDIGTGSSSFLPRMKKLGWDVAGTEIDLSLVEHFRSQHDIELFHGQLEDAGFPEKTFDAVTMFGVLEHVAAPAALLKEVSRILKDGGSFCLFGFNRSVEARLLGRFWPGFDPPRHVYSFSAKHLEYLLQEAGLQVTSISFSPVCYIPYGLFFAYRQFASAILRRGRTENSVRMPRGLNLLGRPLAGFFAKARCSSSMYVFAKKF